ncbi:MAG: hypothetical protein GXO75_01260 [Calditrichaeota bacterium]|nr:hypothetical protein [Calditrichota bacterium]
MDKIQRFQQELYTNYLEDLNILPENYKYQNGVHVKPVVPVDTFAGGVMIIGAYPSAHFATINSATDVPDADILYPFPKYNYFDGSRVRPVKSGIELKTKYLKPLHLKRKKCWITNLVRVFLFKKGHIEKYKHLGCSFPGKETRSLFYEIATAGRSWLIKEVELAKPKLIITLGREVAGFFHDIKNPEKQNELLTTVISEITIGTKTYPSIHFAHPGIIMRQGSDRNKWPQFHQKVAIPKAFEMMKIKGVLN